MLFTTSKENLYNAIAAVQKAINPKSIIPMYSCIKVEVRDNTAIFTGASLDVSIECTIPVQAEREGCALIHARYISEIVRRLPDIPITIEHTESLEMTIRYEKSVFNLKTMRPDDFPAIEEFKGGLDFSISAEILKKLVRQSSFASSVDEVKGVFTGLLWEVGVKELSVIGTDTHRLAWVKGPVTSGDVEMMGNFIISSRVAVEISRLSQSGDCHIQAEKNTVFFSFDNIRVNCRVMEGSFPNFRQVIPTQFVTEIQVDSKQLRDVTDRISLFSAGTEFSNTINMEIKEGALSLHSRSDIGFGREELPVGQNGEDMEIAFNSRYISDVFKAVEGESVDIKLSGQLSAGIIQDREDEDFLYLILPVKV